jgi:hypothetical protein
LVSFELLVHKFSLMLNYLHISFILNDIRYRHDVIKLCLGIFRRYKRTKICDYVDSFVLNFDYCFFSFCEEFLAIFVHEIFNWNFVSFIIFFIASSLKHFTIIAIRS